MKLRPTTPASISLPTRLILGAIVLVAVVGVSLQMSHQTSADQYDDKINALQQDIDNYNNQATQLKAQADTYQAAAQTLQSQASVIQAQIDISQTKYNQLTAQIADTEQKIKDNQNALGDTIADMYVADKVTPIEMLASSKNINDYLDRQAYRSSVGDQLTSTIAQIKTLKTQLDTQKTEVTRVLGDQQNAKAALVAKQDEQQNLFNQTQGQEAAYQQLVSTTQSKQNDVRAQQQAAIAAAYKSTGGATLIKGGAEGNYPWNSSNCAMTSLYPGGPAYYSTGGTDGNGGDGKTYGCRQCASYAAWRVARETGYYPTNWGNATDFPSSARSVGYQTGSSPRPGSLAVMHNGAEGHVAWVESVGGDGTIIVSQYNYNYGAGYGLYSEMKLYAAAFQEYVYIK